jgi:fumarate reductase iron-sulfur subunit
MKVRVWRGGTGGAFQVFEVPRLSSQTVLDVVTYIQRKLDPTLAYRYACRVGMCGSCAMTVNGVARWTCRTHVDKVARGDRLEIGPLKNLPVIRDLVTDMREFFDKWARAKGEFKGARTRHDDFARISPETRKAVDAGIECIGCAVCYSSCNVVAANPAYLGPAAGMDRPLCLRLRVPVWATVSLIERVDEPVLRLQPSVSPASKFGLPTRLWPSATCTTTSSRNRFGKADGVTVLTWLRYSTADRTTPAVGVALGWQSAPCAAMSRIPLTCVHTPGCSVKP